MRAVLRASGDGGSAPALGRGTFFRRNARVAFLLVGTAGCVSSSIESDVGRVRELTRVEHLAAVADRDVDPGSAADTRKLLARPLDADAAVRVAMLDNRELRASLRELGIERGQLRQAGFLPNPTVEAELVPERDTKLELRVEYNITRALLAPMRAGAAGAVLDAARYRTAGELLALGYRVRAAFYGLQAANQRLALAQQTLDAWAASRDAAVALQAAGNINELELAKQEAAYQRQRVSVAMLELDASSARERLQRLLGAQGADASWQITPAFPALPAAPSIPAQLETKALRASLQLKETAQRLESLARRAGYTRTAGWIPDVLVDVHGLQGSDDPAATKKEREWKLGAGVQLEVPLFDRGQGNASALDAELDGLLERYYGMALAIRSTAREAASQLESAHARALQYRDTIIPAQQRVTQQTLLQYNAMQIGVFDLLQARRDELEVRLEYMDALRQYWSAAAALDALLAGGRLPSDDGREASSSGNTQRAALGGE
jgi:outer membrane protein TolC